MFALLKEVQIQPSDDLLSFHESKIASERNYK